MPFYEDYVADFTMSYYRDIPQNNAGMHVHPQYEMLVVLDNVNTRITVNGKVYCPVKPYIALFAPFSLHHTEFLDRVVTARYVYYFSENMVKSYPEEFREFETYKRSTSTIFMLPDEFVQRLRPIHENALKNKGDVAVARLLFLMNLHLLLKEKDECLLIQTNDQMNHINTIVRYMTEHFHEDLTSESIAQMFFISRSKFNRDFREYTTISFHQFLIELRVSKAKFMLKNGCSIHEVANSVGFENDSYFCQFFKKETGVTPLQFAKGKRAADKKK